jgi:hypothetical protein
MEYSKKQTGDYQCSKHVDDTKVSTVAVMILKFCLSTMLGRLLLVLALVGMLHGSSLILRV